MDDGGDIKDSLKEAIKKKIKDKLKKELLDEIYSELRSVEDELTEEITDLLDKKTDKITQEVKKESEAKTKTISHEKAKPARIGKPKKDEKVTINVKSVLKIASHALKYANENIPKAEWVEVIGLLAGKVDKDGETLHIEDAYPMGHGNAIYAEIKDYNNFTRAYQDIRKQKLFICGWYHSHPSYSPFMSTEDIGTQARYQKLWKDSVALVIDPYEIDGTRLGFEIYRANLNSQKWYPVRFRIKGDLDIKMLPELLNFINPIVDGKAIYLEYDED